MAHPEALLSPAELVQTQLWRYATKKFDPTRRIAPDAWAALEQSLMLSPSSFGLQPWKFVVVTDPEVRARLRTASWNQAQVEECSHLVVFLAKDTIREADVDHFLARTAEVRGQSLESLEPYKSMMMGGLVNGPRAAQLDQWTARQAYIALGNFMTSAALLGVDTCPMEGFDPAQYDRILGLEGSGFHAVVVCPAGYRAQDDAYAARPKVRFLPEELVAHI
jgi:nitroreductase